MTGAFEVESADLGLDAVRPGADRPSAPRRRQATFARGAAAPRSDRLAL
jgi:hypothetical protein